MGCRTWVSASLQATTSANRLSRTGVWCGPGWSSVKSTKRRGSVSIDAAWLTSRLPPVVATLSFKGLMVAAAGKRSHPGTP